MNFFYNIFISLWCFAGWYVAGLGPALILLPASHRRYGFLLAPLLGMSLLTLIGLFEITVLLIPLYSKINVIGLVLISLFFCFWIVYKNPEFLKQKSKQSLSFLFLIPLIFVFAFAWLFHNGGFQLLVGGSDQLQYSLDARQIVERMHTHSSDDLPIIRYDHILYDVGARSLPYLKGNRRGAEVLLAATSAVTGLSYEEAFPVTILNALLTLGLSLGFLGRFFLYLSRYACLGLQIAFLSSFFFLLIHIQGSLALILGIAPNIVGLALISRVVRDASWRWLIMAALVVASYFSIYSEPAVINMILPSTLMFIFQLRRSWIKNFWLIQRLVILALLISVCAPFAIYSVESNFIGNLHASILSYIQSHHVIKGTTLPFLTLAVNATTQWNLAMVIMGAISYYDLSAFNMNLSSFIANKSWIALVVFLMLGSFALMGYLKTKNLFIIVFAVPLILWISAALIFSIEGDTLRFARGLQYTMPFAIFGLVIFASRYRRLLFGLKFQKSSGFYLLFLGKVIVLFFIGMNVYTSARTMNYLSSHDVSNDQIVLHFDVRAREWQLLRKELRFSCEHHLPILISGFKETVRPLVMISLIGDQSHVIGKSILSFWPVYNMRGNLLWSSLNTRFSKKELTRAQMQEEKRWSIHATSDLINRSMQAVVPQNYGFPNEWSSYKDIYNNYVRNFANICDIVYRDEYAVHLDKELVSPLMKDVNGIFRILKKSGSIKIKDYNTNMIRRLIISYNGDLGDVKVQIRDRFYEGRIIKNPHVIRIAINVHPEDLAALKLNVVNPVKLRSMTLSQVK